MENHYGARRVGKDQTAASDVYLLDVESRRLIPAFMRRAARVLTLRNWRTSATA